jgi:tetratricopeptide (TPR) repeat protein/DNA-binding MarR family transcriptional regulator
MKEDEMDGGKAPGLTVQERALLHMHRFRAFSDAFEVPAAVCQPGIAKGVGVRRSHISIVLKGLRDKGLAEERMSHVRGGRRRQKVYQLSAKGQAEAQRLMEELEKKGTPLDQVLASITDTGEGQVRSWTVPEVKYFFGREDELAQFNDFLKSGTVRAFAIQGLPGIGKTTFLARAVQGVREAKERPVFWFTFREWSGLRGLLSDLSTFLSEMGIGTLSKVLVRYGSGPVDLDAAAGAVLEAGTLLLVIDDVHLLDEKTTLFLKALVQSDAKSGLKVALAGRSLPRFFSVREAKVRLKVRELTLEGLGPEEGERLYRAVASGQTADFGKVYPLSKGHPLSIELIGLAGGSTLDSQRFIFEEIYKVLNDEERAAMRAASVHREPVLAEGLFLEKGVTYKALDELVHRGLLRPVDRGLRAHELVRDFFYKRLSPTERRALHAAAAQFHLEEGGDGPWLEAHYHLIRAGQARRSAELLMTRASELLRKGHHEEILNIAIELEGGDVGERLVDVLKVRAEIQHLYGDRSGAKATCEIMMDAAKRSNDRRAQVQGQILMGAIAYEVEAWDDAIRWYDGALKLSEELDDSECMAKAYNNLGILYWRLARIGEAIKCYDRSLAIAERMGDRPGIARIKANLGIIHMEGGDCERARECYEASLAISEELDDKKTSAILYGNLGELHQKEGRADEARGCFEKSLELAEAVGHRQQAEEARRNLRELK